MKRYLVIQTNKKEIIIAILQKGKLSEVYFNCNETNTMIGDIYLGLIKNTDDSLKVAFINIGSVKDAFLHYYDFGAQFKCLLEFLSIKNFNYLSQVYYHLEGFTIDWYLNKTIQSNTKILTQITKESISNKVPKLTTEITLAGKFLVLIPYVEKIYASQVIRDYKKRKIFIYLFKVIQPSFFGIIVKKGALKNKYEVLKKDFIYLTNKWRSLLTKLKTNNPPSILMRNIDTSYYIFKFLYNVTSIICDNQDLCEEISDFISTIQPNKFNIIKHYSDEIVPIFEKYGIEKHLKMSLGKNIPLIFGAYLIIDHTEALHVIDVNTGSVEEINQKKNILDINLIAATEIYRQLKLRDIGGIIVIDFIDMLEIEHSKNIFEHFKVVMKNDTAKYKILPINKFGLIQLTRESARHEFNYQNEEKNPNNPKYKKVESPIEHLYRIESILQKVMNTGKKCILQTHPFIAAYLKAGCPSLQQKWFFKFKKWIKIIPRYSFKYLEYQVIDNDNNIIFLYKNLY